MEPTIGFIILRHVSDEITNNYWIECYKSIRELYSDNLIVIIDDNSNHNFITSEPLHKVVIIHSEYKGRGELLPYYYYSIFKFFDIAVILHDSTIINTRIDFNVDQYKFIWDFGHTWDQIEDETKMIKIFEDPLLLEFYQDKNRWRGCFGGMSIIRHDFLVDLDKKYNLSKLLDLVGTRYNRCSFERVIGCMLQYRSIQPSLLGDIHQYCPWAIRYYERNNYRHLPITKYWSGR